MTSAGDLLDGLPVSRVVELPRRSTPASPQGDPGRRLRLAAIVSSYHGGRGLLLGWHRQSAGAAVDVFASGGHGFGMRRQGTSSDHWIDALYYWLEAQGLTRRAGEGK